jgi:NAD(P)-dependent dehydrogenase (short-subunit alcohol dehydrogenase family)
VNVVGAHRLLRAVLPGMRERRDGLLVLVSSGMGRLVLPLMGAYSASKAALEALTDAYRYELRPSGVDATIVQPGVYPTEFRSRLVVGHEQARARGYGPLAHALEGWQASIDQMAEGPDAQDPEAVAAAIVGLVDAAPGTRPDRIVVDRATPQGVLALNEAHLQVQKGMLTAMGMADLAG